VTTGPVARLADVERAMLTLDGALWLEPRLRELVEIRTAELNGSLSALARHVREALELGEGHERIAAVAGWRRSPLFTERERAALALAESVALLPDPAALVDVWCEATKHFGEHELAQLVLACVVANAWNRYELLAEGVPEAA
jgi:AhpD family alkylhydroperoxidase